MEYKIDPAPPLYVDLDGTFCKSDLLFESLVIALKSNPLIIFMCFVWLLKGRSYLKSKLSARADINTELLPLNPHFYAFLLEEKAKGREIILATASDKKYADGIYQHFDIFDSFISSDGETNLKGEAKLARIQSMSQRFAYAGNASEDFVLFDKAAETYLVNPTRKAQKMADKGSFTQVFDDDTEMVRAWGKQLRLHQWLKNLLIFVPLLVSGSFIQPSLVMLAALGFVSFSLLASGTYIINDLLDLDADRSHQRKRFRPLAAGIISIIDAKVAVILLTGFAFSLATMVSVQFSLVLLVYLVLTLSYSLAIKQYIGLDVITLASLYTIRILAGAVLLGVTVSFWLLSFSMFVFLSLALVKRCAELKSFESEGKTVTKGRDYNVLDYGILANLGTASAMLSVLMFCFYVNSNVLTDQYQQPSLLWLIVPALCYWMMRMWIKTHRGEMHDDPIVFSLKDRGSKITIGFIGLTALLAQTL